MEWSGTLCNLATTAHSLFATCFWRNFTITQGEQGRLIFVTRVNNSLSLAVRWQTKQISNRYIAAAAADDDDDVLKYSSSKHIWYYLKKSS